MLIDSGTRREARMRADLERVAGGDSGGAAVVEQDWQSPSIGWAWQILPATQRIFNPRV